MLGSNRNGKDKKSDTKGSDRMSKEEIQELLDLNHWEKIDLAARLRFSENSVHKWLNGSLNPGKLVSSIMREWLDDARAKMAGAK